MEQRNGCVVQTNSTVRQGHTTLNLDCGRTQTVNDLTATRTRRFYRQVVTLHEPASALKSQQIRD